MSQNNPFISSDLMAADSLEQMASVLRFVEEAASNHGASLKPDSAAYSSDAWGGMSLILGIVREGMEDIARRIPHDV